MSSSSADQPDAELRVNYDASEIGFRPKTRDWNDLSV
jgi:hypothetical protein